MATTLHLVSILHLLIPITLQENTSTFHKQRPLRISPEKLLTQYLMENYEMVGRGGRPVVDFNTTTLVEFGLGLIQIDLDESEKVLTSSMWTRMKWQDEYLTWNPSDFAGLTAVRIEADYIWTPDIMLFNTADPENAVRNALIMVFPDGSLMWVLHQIFRSSCSIDVVNFPFDTQVCHMWFGSWTHAVHEIDLNFSFPAGIDLSTFQSDYKESSEWDIIKTQANRLVQDDIAVLSFDLHMQRKMVFSSYILTLPCVFLACLTLVVFCLPPERPDRTGLAMSIFSSFLVLLLILVEAAPSSASSVPKLGIYYCFNMSIIMVSIFLSSMVVNVNRAGDGTRRLPRWMYVIFLQILSPIFCSCPYPCKRQRRKAAYVKTPGELESRKLTSDSPTGGRDNELEASLSAAAAAVNATTTTYSDTVFLLNGNVSDRMRFIERWFGRVERQIEDVRRSLAVILGMLDSRRKEAYDSKTLIMEWRHVAKVMDRLFVVLYLAAIILSIAYLFPLPKDVLVL